MFAPAVSQTYEKDPPHLIQFVASCLSSDILLRTRDKARYEVALRVRVDREALGPGLRGTSFV
jgi:hypothetical protein